MTNWLKEITDASITTSLVFAGDALNYIVQYFKEVDHASGDPTMVAKINTETRYASGKLRLWDSDKSHTINFATPNFTENKTINIPSTLGAIDTLLMEGNVAAITNKTIDFNANVMTNLPTSAFTNGGLAQFNGNGTTTQFLIPHSQGSIPTIFFATKNSVDALGEFSVTADATNIIITYATPPPTGTNNVKLIWASGAAAGPTNPNVIPSKIRIGVTGGTYTAINSSGTVLGTSTNIVTLLTSTIHPALTEGDTIDFQTGVYTGTGIYNNSDKPRIRFEGNGSTLSGCKIKIGKSTAGATTDDASECMIRDFFITGAAGGVIFDNTRGPSIEDVLFDGCDEALSIESTQKWTEFLAMERVHFNNCKKSLVFKTPVSPGTGSYVNSYLNHVTFNSTSTWNPAQGTYTFIEVQSGADVAEGKWLNMRLWVNSQHSAAICLDHTGSASRCQLFRPYFENFTAAQSAIGIRYNAGATSAFMLVGKPVFSGAGTWTGKFINSSNISMHGPVTSWRQSHTITPSASADTYGSVVNCLNSTEYGDIPNIYVTIGGTVGATEIITVEIKAITYSATNSIITKAYYRTGTYGLTATDYIGLTPNNFYTTIDYFEVKAKSSIASTTATVVLGGFNGGSTVGYPLEELVTVRKDHADLITLHRPNSSAIGTGIKFRLGTTGEGLNYANFYGHAVVASPLEGKITFQIANAGTVAERLSIAGNGTLTLADTANLVLGSTTGTKIGTATTQKLGFFNKTPVVQRSAIASPTADSASLKTAVDLIRLVLSDLGLTA